MNSKTESSSSSAAPTPLCRRPPSLEMTPDEFDYFIKQAHRVRAETITAFVSGWMAALARIFVRIFRAMSLSRPRAPAGLADKQAQSRAA